MNVEFGICVNYGELMSPFNICGIRGRFIRMNLKGLGRGGGVIFGAIQGARDDRGVIILVY